MVYFITFLDLDAPIELLTGLPSITDDYTIINGNDNTISGITSITSFSIASSFNEITGLNLTGFPSEGVGINGDNNIISNCQIYGTNSYGVYIYGNGNIVQNCQIYNNGRDGVALFTDADNNQLLNNNIS